MYRFGSLALLAGCALANPVPQGFDWDAIEGLDPLPTATIPVVNAEAAQTTISFAPSAAASAVESAVLADPSDTSVQRRGAAPAVDSNNAQCSAQPNTTDTAADWQNNPTWAQSANSALTPAGYQQAYVNRNGSSQGVYGYMGYSILDQYDSSVCSARCDQVVGCQSFNIYYERDPSVDPKSGCTNPPSQTVIKCVYYGGPVTAASTTNTGQWRDDFQVVIAGSNGYVNNSISTPSGYSDAIPLGNAAINALNDCNKGYTYMGVKIFQDGPFSVEKCAAACSAVSDYNRRHPAKNGYVQTCQFFNTYVLYNSSVAVGQYCSLYNETWPSSYATNVGQWRGKNYFSIGYSYAFSNSTGGKDQPVGCSNPATPPK